MASPPIAEDLDVWEWSTEKVSAYVRKQGKQLKRLAAIIDDKKLTGEQVLDLLPQDLTELGFEKKPARSKAMKVINHLRDISGAEGVMTLAEARRRDPNNTDNGGAENPDNTNFGATDKPSFCRLNRWLKAHGADLSKVYLDPEQRILRCRRQIQKGEPLVYLPPSLFMSTMLARTDSKFVQHLEKKMELGTHSLISIYMLDEMKNKKTTFWQPYIDVIPEKYDDIPIFWSDNEVKELQGDALSRYHRRRDTLSNDYDRICENCPAFKDMVTLEEFMWARTAVITRTFGLKVNGQKITSNLPIDFVMHANQPDTTWGYDQNKGCYHITAVRTIPKNKFLTITYGKKANARFLVNYGFCLPVNSRNKGFLEFDYPQFYGHPDAADKDIVECDISVEGVTKVLKKCLDLSKVHFTEKPGFWEQREFGWTYLQTKTQENLDAFPTTLAFDLEQLERKDISQNTRNAILSRSGEKIVVDFYNRLATGALVKLNSLRDKWTTRKAEMEEAGASKKEITDMKNGYAKKMFEYPRDFTTQNLIVDPEL